jgi:ribosomal protein S18 acetylase RimI-like enzyme
MVVHPNHFRKGIAQMLLYDLEENNPESTILKVSTGKDNFPAKSLYMKNGYQFIRDHLVHQASTLVNLKNIFENENRIFYCS